MKDKMDRENKAMKDRLDKEAAQIKERMERENEEREKESRSGERENMWGLNGFCNFFFLNQGIDREACQGPGGAQEEDGEGQRGGK